MIRHAWREKCLSKCFLATLDQFRKQAKQEKLATLASLDSRSASKVHSTGQFSTQFCQSFLVPESGAVTKWCPNAWKSSFFERSELASLVLLVLSFFPALQSIAFSTFVMVMMLWHCVSTATNGWKKCNVSCFEEFVYIWVSCLFTFESAVCLQL